MSGRVHLGLRFGKSLFDYLLCCPAQSIADHQCVWYLSSLLVAGSQASQPPREPLIDQEEISHDKSSRVLTVGLGFVSLGVGFGGGGLVFWEPRPWH